MTDTEQLRRYIYHSGMKLSHVARVLGISTGALYCKLNNETDFKIKEAETLSALLELTERQRDECFFAPNRTT